jgi:hypothetical protein
MLPRGWDRRTIVLLTFALLFVIAAHVAEAQAFDLERDRVQMAELHGFWRFHTGDDPDGKLGWAKPDFDDSNWKLLRSDQPLAAQGYPGFSGMAWYRFQVMLPQDLPPLALHVAGLGTSYQVFAGGRLIRQFGGLPPQEKIYAEGVGGPGPNDPPLGQVIPIPPSIAAGKGSMIVAIRVWIWPDWASAYGMQRSQALSIGEATLINDQWQYKSNYEFWYLSANNALLLGSLLAGLGGIALFLLRPGEREYLWFGAAELVNAVDCFWRNYPVFHPVWYQGYLAAGCALLLVRSICISMFFVILLKMRQGWPFWSVIGSILFVALMVVPGVMHWMSDEAFGAAFFLAFIPLIVTQIVMLSLAARRGNVDARLVLGPWSLQIGAILGSVLLTGIDASGHGGPIIALLTEKWVQILSWPFPISVPNIVDFLVQISILAILVLRFARTRRDEERLKAEFEAARTVQQVLIPEEIPAIPGFALQCIYKPAGKVSGDFFQILPTRDGGALVVIGDVSGKGMPAAMAVSLLVGTVRTLAHYTLNPGEILTAMNQRMLARSKDGFTTCLVLRIDSDGTATVANAGHLAPYLGAQELSIDNGLPLGLVAEAVYTESSFQLDAGQELTLITDGVAEARAKSGELFGFERTASISILSAEHIAATAKAFGQEDDITVLKIRRCPVREPALTGPAALPSISATSRPTLPA